MLTLALKLKIIHLMFQIGTLTTLRTSRTFTTIHTFLKFNTVSLIVKSYCIRYSFGTFNEFLVR